MTLAIGFNHPMSSPTDARWGLLSQIGAKGLRDVATPAMLDKAASLGIRMVHVQLTAGSTVIKDWCNQTNGSGVKNIDNPGFSGIITLGNENYFTESAGTYVNRWLAAINDAQSMRTRSGQKLKIFPQGVWKDRQSWIGDTVNAFGGTAALLAKIDGWDLHPYSSLTSGGLDPTSNVYGAAFWGLNNFINDSSQGLVHFGLQAMPIAVTEWGFTDGPLTTKYGAGSQAGQANWVQKQYDVLRSFPTIIASFQFELEDNPWNEPAIVETQLGVVQASAANFTISSAPASQQKQAWAVAHQQCLSSGSMDFTGAIGSGGGGGGGGTFDQVTLARSGDQHSVIASNIDANAVNLKFAATPANSSDNATYYTVPVASDPQTWTPPAYDKPWINVAQFDGTDQLIGTWYDQRVQVFPATADVPVTTTAAADAITTDGGTLHASVALGNQAAGSGRFRYGDSPGVYDKTTPTVPLTGAPTAITTPTLMAAQSGTNSGSGLTATVNNPSTPGAGQNGHKLYAIVCSKGNGATSLISPPSTSWQPVQVTPSGGGTASEHQDFLNAAGTGFHRMAVYQLTCGSAEPASYVFSHTDTTQSLVVVLLEYDGNADRVDPASTFAISSSGQSFAIPAGLAVHNHDVVIAAVAFANGEAFAPPSGFTEPANADKASGTTTTHVTVEASYKAISADGVLAPGSVVSANANGTGADTAVTVALVIRPVSSGNAATFSAAITGRGPGKLTYFVAEASSLGGTDDGSELSFTTVSGAAPPGVVSGTATAITANSANVGGTVTPNGADTTVRVEWWTDPAEKTTVLYANNPVTSSGPVTIPLAGLPQASDINWQLFGASSIAETPGLIKTFRTLAVSGAAKFSPGSRVQVLDTASTNATAPDWVGVQGIVTFVSPDTVSVATVGRDDHTFDPADLLPIGGTLGGLALGTQVKILAKSPNSLSGKTGTVTWSEGTETVVSVPGHHPYAFSSTADLQVV